MREVHKVTLPTSGKCYECPACRCPTLPRRGHADCCLVCHWQDHGQDDPYAGEVWEGNNGVSLHEARTRVGAGLPAVPVMEDAEDRGVRLRLLEAYQNLLREQSPAEAARLQARIVDLQGLLHAALERHAAESDRLDPPIALTQAEEAALARYKTLADRLKGEGDENRRTLLVIELKSLQPILSQINKRRGLR